MSIARQAESHLETQKQENLQLKETIDRMRFELDEARSNNAASGHSRGVTGSSGAPTLSRNLGAEISRRLEESQEVSEEEEDSYVETVVTTQKTRVCQILLCWPSLTLAEDWQSLATGNYGDHRNSSYSLRRAGTRVRRRRYLNRDLG